MKKIILLTLVFFALIPASNATHVVGGDISFSQTGRNTYDVIMRLYRDCSGSATLSSNETINVLNLSTCTNAATISMSRVPGTITTGTGTGGTPIQFGDECYTPNLCVEEHYYTGTVTLSDNPAGYTAQWSVCCRNTTVNLNGQPVGAIYTSIPNPGLIGGNSSPVFVDYPRDAYMCINNMKCLDFAATDADGDSLSYELITPVQGFTGCTPNSAPWAAQYNLLNPLGPGSSTIVDAVTGCVNTRPARGGAFVFSVVCSEWRNGVKIGETLRDLQYFSLPCRFNSKPVFEDFVSTSVFKFEEEKCIDIVAKDPNGSDTFFLQINSNAYQFGAVSTLPAVTGGVRIFEWENATTGQFDTTHVSSVRKLNSTTFEGVGKVGARFCWDLDNCDVLSVDSFYLNALGYSLGCDGSKDTVLRTVSIPIQRDPYSYNVPNVFSPNDDGINDLFYLKKDAYDRCYDALNVRVYNRWGQIVFESEDAKFTWDGTDQNGAELSEGTYFVVLQGFYGGKEVTDNFPVSLFR